MAGHPRTSGGPTPLLPSGPGGVHGSPTTRTRPPPWAAHSGAKWRREWDSNPRYVAAHSRSRRAPSSTRSSLHVCSNCMNSDVAEEAGFEPAVGCPTMDFESTAFDHSATPPYTITSWPAPSERTIEAALKPLHPALPNRPRIGDSARGDKTNLQAFPKTRLADPWFRTHSASREHSP